MPYQATWCASGNNASDQYRPSDLIDAKEHVKPERLRSGCNVDQIKILCSFRRNQGRGNCYVDHEARITVKGMIKRSNPSKSCDGCLRARIDNSWPRLRRTWDGWSRPARR